MPDTAQPTLESEAKKSRGPGSFVFWGFVLVMVYVLSSGPVKRYMLSHRISALTSKILHLAYRPIGWAYNDTLLHKPIGMYWHLWCPDYVEVNGAWIRKHEP